MSLKSSKNKPLHFAVIGIIIVLAAIANGFTNWLASDVLEWPVFFDSVFTITIGIFFGWLPGLLTGLITNPVIEIFHGFTGNDWPFAIVNMASGLCAGLIARNKSLFWTIPRQILLILLLTFINSILGALLVIIVFGGLTGTNADILVSALMITGQDIFSSAFLARILVNVVDKGIPVLAIFTIHFVVQNRRGNRFGSRF